MKIRVRIEIGEEEDFGHALKEWFLKLREKDECGSGTLWLWQKGAELAEKLRKIDFMEILHKPGSICGKKKKSSV